MVVSYSTTTYELVGENGHAVQRNRWRRPNNLPGEMRIKIVYKRPAKQAGCNVEELLYTFWKSYHEFCPSLHVHVPFFNNFVYNNNINAYAIIMPPMRLLGPGACRSILCELPVRVDLKRSFYYRQEYFKFQICRLRVRRSTIVHVDLLATNKY